MSKKAAKRLEQKNTRLAKTLEKTAKQFANPPAHKTIPKTDAPLAHEMMRWTRDQEDTAPGSWSWGTECKCCDEDWARIIHPFLLEYETKRWNEIDAERTGKGRKRRQKHIFYTFEQIVSEAYQRLIDLQLDDFAPNIFRFRLSGRRRLYGFRIAATGMFHMIWFDPTHSIYRY